MRAPDLPSAPAAKTERRDEYFRPLPRAGRGYYRRVERDDRERKRETALQSGRRWAHVVLSARGKEARRKLAA